jgi:hypothetical protein
MKEDKHPVSCWTSGVTAEKEKTPIKRLHDALEAMTYVD